MTETKYGKYFIKEPVIEGTFAPRIRFFSGDNFGQINFSLVRNCISGPLLMEEKPHAHSYDQFLCFFGGNPMNVKEFSAEVELSLGQEGEKHIINAATIVHIPKGLVHCPLNFKRVDKPIIFMNVALTPRYDRPLTL